MNSESTILSFDWHNCSSVGLIYEWFDICMVALSIEMVAGWSLTIEAIRWDTVLLGARPETVHGNYR